MSKDNEKSSIFEPFWQYKKLNFSGPPVLVLLLFIGILLKFSKNYLPFHHFFLDIVDVLGNSFLTAGILDIILSFSNQQKSLHEFSDKIYDLSKDAEKRISVQIAEFKKAIFASEDSKAKELCDYIDEMWKKHYFSDRITPSINILDVKDVCGKSGLKKEIFQEELRHYIWSLENYADICANPLVYIHEFDRKVFLCKSEKPDYVKVHTITDITYVNLKNTPYFAVHNPQFLRSDGSGPSYEIICLQIDGEDKTKEIQEILQMADLKPESQKSFYESGKKYEEEIPPHRAKRIYSESIHEMPLVMFYQAKVLVLPCMKFSLRAEIDSDLIQHNPKGKYVFRWTLFETKTDLPYYPHKKPGTVVEGNHGILFLSSECMKPGNGYALTLGIIGMDTTEELD